MQFHLLKSKIHRASVTGGNVDYEGSLTIARDLMDEVELLPYERILCSNMANAERFETYVIPGEPGSGDIVLNGAAARTCQAAKKHPAYRHDSRLRMPLHASSTPTVVRASSMMLPCTQGSSQPPLEGQSMRVPR